MLPPPATADEGDIVMPPLRVSTDGDLRTFTLEGDEPFHETANGVSDVRLVGVPDSAILLILWDEQDPNGLCVPHYAISHDGVFVTRCQDTTYDLWLGYESFDPAWGEPEIPAELTSPDSDDAVYIVQFVTYPLNAFRQRVRALGGEIHCYQSNHAYLVRMSGEARQRVEALLVVRAVVPFHAAYKSAEFWDDAAPPAEATEYNILIFEPGTDQARTVANHIEAVGGSADAVPTAGSLLRATLTAAQLHEIARLPEVAFIGRYNPPVACVDNAREIGGANFVINTLGFTGEGVTGEVMDQGHAGLHVEYPGSPFYPEGFRRHGPSWWNGCTHSTPVTGIVFATGVGPPGQEGTAKGFLPGAGPQNRITADKVWVTKGLR